LRTRLLALAEGPAGPTVLIVSALLEATVFPGPTEAILVALTLLRRERALRWAVTATAASVAGGLVGYHLGRMVYPEMIQPLLDSYGVAHYADAVNLAYRENMLLALTTSGYTPIPYLLYTALAGAAELPLSPFVLGSAVGRGLKYLPIAMFVYVLGPRVHGVLRQYGAAATVVFALVVALWLIVRLMR
jgi:membrane protein YqaA with SNARE-associated domain